MGVVKYLLFDFSRATKRDVTLNQLQKETRIRVQLISKYPLWLTTQVIINVSDIL